MWGQRRSQDWGGFWGYTGKVAWGVVVAVATVLGVGSALLSIAAAFSPEIPQPWEVPVIFFRAAEVIIEIGEILIGEGW